MSVDWRARWLVFGIGAAGAVCGVLAMQHWQVQAAADGDAATDNLPRVLPYEGEIIRDGVPLNGTANVRFRVESASGTVLYSERHAPNAANPPVDLVNGRFSVVLGPDPALTAAIEDGEPLYMRLEVSNGSGGWTLLDGRQQIGSAAYALWSGSGTDLAVGDSVRVGADAIASPADAGLYVDVDGMPEARFYDFFVDSEADAENSVANLVSGAAVQADGSYAYTNANRDATRMRFSDTADERFALIVDDISGGAPAENNTVVWKEPALRVDHQGRVGIGKQPSATLDVEGMVRAGGLNLVNSAAFDVSGTWTSGVSLPAAATFTVGGQQRPIRFGRVYVGDNATTSLGIDATSWHCSLGGFDMDPAQAEQHGNNLTFNVNGSNEWQVYFNHTSEGGGGVYAAYVCFSDALF